MIKTLIATAALATIASAASAETYRLDISAAEGVKFAPWANEAAVDNYVLSINGSPKVASNSLFGSTGIPGVVSEHGHWFIFEAEQGDEISLVAMQGNSIDQYGRITFTLPSDMDNYETKDVMESQVVDTMVIMTGEDEQIVKEIFGDVKVGEEEVYVDTTPAARMISGDIEGVDTGADEGTMEETAVENKGTWTVIQLGK